MVARSVAKPRCWPERLQVAGLVDLVDPQPGGSRTEEQLADDLCRVVVELGHVLGVDVEGERDRGVAEALTDDLGAPSGPQGSSRTGGAGSGNSVRRAGREWQLVEPALVHDDRGPGRHLMPESG